MASGLKSQDKIHIVFRIGFTIDFFKEKQVEKNSDLITKLTGGSPIMERHLIGAAELLCVPKPKLFAVLIKQLYEEDCLEEDVILEWACEGRSDYTLDAVDEPSIPAAHVASSSANICAVESMFGSRTTTATATTVTATDLMSMYRYVVGPQEIV